jgi:hypothetical protein
MTVDLIAFRPVDGIELADHARLVLAAFAEGDPGALPLFDADAVIQVLRLRLPTLVRYADDALAEAHPDYESGSVSPSFPRFAWVDDDGNTGIEVRVSEFAVGVSLPLDGGDIDDRALGAVERIARVLRRDLGLVVYDPHGEQTVDEAEGEFAN